MANGGYLSRDPERLAALQRSRRRHVVRMDYMPGSEALSIIEAHRERFRPGSQSATNSAVLDAIVTEWAGFTGIKYQPKSKPMTSGQRTELIDMDARARMSSETPDFLLRTMARTENRPKQSATRVRCGAKRHRDGQPCQARSEPGKRRCRFHGGRSTGPRTPEGMARALANLRRGKAAGSMG